MLTGPQIRKLIVCDEFKDKLNLKQFLAWGKVVEVIQNFLGNHRAKDYEKTVAQMSSALKNCNVLMNAKIHYIHNHLNKFSSNCGQYSEEHGERFHQDIAPIEKRYKGKNLIHMLGEYTWSLCHDEQNVENKRRSNKLTF